MNVTRTWICCVTAAALVVSLDRSAEATTLIRMSLQELAEANSSIVIGTVLDAVSYWNQDGSFILTDVRVAPESVLKGAAVEDVIVVTVMGGVVGDLSALIVAGPELFPMQSYVLFLNKEDLPGAESALTVRDLSQGAFEIGEDGKGGLRVVSQASRHALLPDRSGVAAPPGGAEGIPLDDFVQSVSVLTRRAPGTR